MQAAASNAGPCTTVDVEGEIGENLQDREWEQCHHRGNAQVLKPAQSSCNSVGLQSRPGVVILEWSPFAMERGT